MSKKDVSVSHAFKVGWELTKEYIEYILGYEAILILIWALHYFINTRISGWRMTVSGILFWIVNTFTQLGWYNSMLLISNRTRPNFDQLYKNGKYFINWVIAHILFSLLILVGFLLLIVPGFYFIVRYAFLPFVILDKDAGPIEAFSLAAEASSGMRWRLLLFILAAIGLNLLGFLLLVVGLLFTAPITWLAFAYLYRQSQRLEGHDVVLVRKD